MRTPKHFFLLFVILTALHLAAQVPRVELFGGYSFSNGNPELSSERLNLHGWNTSLTVNVNRWFGVVSDFSGHYGSTDILLGGIPCNLEICPAVVLPVQPVPATLKANNHTFLFGPRLSFRRTKATAFVHALFGAEHLSARDVLVNGTFPLSPQTGFALGLGGGIDYRVTPLLAWRTQANYLGTRQVSDTQNNVRLSTGIVFRFGR